MGVGEGWTVGFIFIEELLLVGVGATVVTDGVWHSTEPNHDIKISLLKQTTHLDTVLLATLLILTSTSS